MLSTGFIAALMGVSFPVFGQQAPILKDGQVTEAALVDALTPEPAAEAPIRTRSIRVMRDDESGGGHSGGQEGRGVARKPASASLLITFETNSAALTARAKRILDVVGDALASDKLGSFRFGIEGYADPRGVSAVNLKLSQARAESVRDYLVASKHIDRARLEPVGKGDQELLNKANPIAPENRRVTIVNLSK
ncbi:MAG: OmpA family protein [Massilia sp.]|jgi:outer membrane protein OmpA-like peptidoglycan-associated protein|nr:OmpA family protein [Massilia sp.]